MALAGAVAWLVAAAPAQSSTLTFNFNTGLQGWTQIGTASKAPWNSSGSAWGASSAGSIYGYDSDDGSHATYWVRSPVFTLDGSGPLTVRLWGGKANAARPATVADVPTDAISGAGFKGVVLRDVATDTYVASLSSASDGGNGQYSLSVADLASFVAGGKMYTLDFLDYDYGGWGWVGLDDVTIPGYLMEITAQAAVPVLLKGAASTVAVTIPTGYNASAAVVVYVTNNNPTALSVNGSANAMVPVTFAAGGATRQDLAVVGTGLGYAKLNFAATGLAGTSTGINVVPASGLIGHWLNGAEDLQDKSGYMAAGTHDGQMVSGSTAAFSADVPAGATGSSLDITASGGAVMITNTVTTDAGYRPTFDEGTAMQMSVAFWAKGLPGSWNPFVSKYGEDATGWQVRRRSDSSIGTFTLRSTGGEDDPNSGSTAIDDGAWHHFAATWDGVAGVRKLYVDGKLNNLVPHDIGPMGLANVNYLTLGGRCSAGSASPGNVFFGFLYDVRIYGLPLSGSAVQRLFSGDASSVLAYADTSVIDLGKTGQVSVSIPAAANATAAVTVYVTNTTPAVVSVAGAVGNVVTLTFPAGGVTSQALTLTGLAEGQAQLACAATGLTGGSVTVKVYGPHLIGRWFNGSESYTNSANFTPAGTHDGIEVGNVGTLTFSSDTPPSKQGKAAQFGGAVGLMIANSSLLDANYQPTFDDVIANQFSVAFWAKGYPSSWNGFVSKRGEEAIGWQVRRYSSSVHGTFTIRSTGSGKEDPEGSIAIDDGLWHHFAAVWDGWNGTRKLYVDGVLDTNLNLTGDSGPLMMAPNHHLILGAREVGSVSAVPGAEGWFTGLLYDMRLYNYPLTQTEVKDLAYVAAIKVAPVSRSLPVSKSMVVDVILPAGANQSQAVVVQVNNNTPTLASLTGAVGDVLTLTYAVGSSLTQQVSVVGLADGKAKLTAAGGGFSTGSATFNVWSDPGSKLIGRWFAGESTFADTSGFRPAGTHTAIPVASSSGDPNNVTFSAEVPTGRSGMSLDLNSGNVAVMITNSATTDADYVETFDGQMANKFSITFWAKGTPTAASWNPWISKRGEDNKGYQVRRYSDSSPTRPTFTIRGTTGEDDPSTSTEVDTTTWHHYAATWDGATGIRSLYFDGVRILAMSADFGPMTPASGDHLMLGARDSGGFGNFFPGLLYDVRVYSYALDALEVATMVNPPTTFSLTLAPLTLPTNQTARLVVTLPETATATAPVTVWLTNNSPGVVTIVGSAGNVYGVTFPVGTTYKVVYLKTIGAGQIQITAGLASGETASLSTVNIVVPASLIGRWFTGAADLVDHSGYTPAGIHDGLAIGGTPAALAFSTDVPPGFAGQSLDLTANATNGITVGVLVTNTATSDTAYEPSFDNGIASSFSVTCWAKGLPGEWSGFVSKRGEDGIGWQVRRYGSANYETFTIRGGGAGIDDPSGSILINDGAWHHFAAVWDGLMGTRKCYVDGILDTNINLIGDFGPMSLAPNHHVVIGARESGTPGSFESWFNGKIYDVRVYNYPISAAEVAALSTAPAQPKLAVQKASGNLVRISWPTSFAGYSLQESSLLTGGWTASSLTVTQEGTENVVYSPTTSSPRFFRLKQ